MTNPVALNLRKTRPTLWALSLALGTIYAVSGFNILLNPVELLLQQPQQAVLVGFLGAVPVGVFSVALGVLHLIGIFGKRYDATMAAYLIGMGYLSAWGISYLFVFPVRPNLAIVGFIGIVAFIFLTLQAIKERVQVHNL